MTIARDCFKWQCCEVEMSARRSGCVFIVIV